MPPPLHTQCSMVLLGMALSLRSPEQPVGHAVPTAPFQSFLPPSQFIQSEVGAGVNANLIGTVALVQRYRQVSHTRLAKHLGMSERRARVLDVDVDACVPRLRLWCLAWAAACIVAVRKMPLHCRCAQNARRGLCREECSDSELLPSQGLNAYASVRHSPELQPHCLQLINAEINRQIAAGRVRACSMELQALNHWPCLSARPRAACRTF